MESMEEIGRECKRVDLKCDDFMSLGKWVVVEVEER